MSLGLLGHKVGMTQIFLENGVAEPVTVIELGPCPVLQIRTKEIDGYSAVQLGVQSPTPLRPWLTRAQIASNPSARCRSYSADGLRAQKCRAPPFADPEVGLSL